MGEEGANLAMSERDAEDWLRFDAWIDKFEIEYPTNTEKLMRFSVFQKYLRELEALIEEDPRRSQFSGVNVLADRTMEELEKDFFGYAGETDSETDDDEVGEGDGGRDKDGDHDEDRVEVPVKCQRRGCDEKDTKEDVTVLKEQKES